MNEFFYFCKSAFKKILSEVNTQLTRNSGQFSIGKMPVGMGGVLSIKHKSGGL